MATQQHQEQKKYFTVAQANAILPLVTSILRDVTALAQELAEKHERLKKLEGTLLRHLDRAHREEVEEIIGDYEQGQDRMQALAEELAELGVELKDPFTGLVDFRTLFNGREVYLCWRLGESEVGHWHDLDAGFAGRQKLPHGVR
jgi:hypothetical protein